MCISSIYIVITYLQKSVPLHYIIPSLQNLGNGLSDLGKATWSEFHHSLL